MIGLIEMQISVINKRCGRKAIKSNLMPDEGETVAWVCDVTMAIKPVY